MSVYSTRRVPCDPLCVLCIFYPALYCISDIMAGNTYALPLALMFIVMLATSSAFELSCTFSTKYREVLAYRTKQNNHLFRYFGNKPILTRDVVVGDGGDYDISLTWYHIKVR